MSGQKQLRGANNSGQVVQGFAPDPSQTQVLSLDASGGANDSQTVDVTGWLAARFIVDGQIDVDVQAVYTDANGQSQTEIVAWRDYQDTRVLWENITGLKFTNQGAAAITVRVQGM